MMNLEVIKDMTMQNEQEEEQEEEKYKEMIIIIAMKLKDVRQTPKTRIRRRKEKEEEGDDEEDKRSRIGTIFLDPHQYNQQEAMLLTCYSNSNISTLLPIFPTAIYPHFVTPPVCTAYLEYLLLQTLEVTQHTAHTPLVQRLCCSFNKGTSVFGLEVHLLQI